MIQLLKRAQIVANSKATVMIQGESGTGKELLARYIHGMSPRGDKPLVAINCAAIPENLLESELFGHEKGAFTGANTRKIGKFEQAEGSTLLLDEIGEMNMALQAKLLRVLQEWQVDRVGGREPISVDIRVIATTNADLAQGVKDGKFREDLYFRLNVVPLTLPPLRDRRSDIGILAQQFLVKSAQVNGKEIKGFKPEALKVLSEHPWKGNIRELKNVVELAVILAEGPLLDVPDIGIEDRDISVESENGIGVLDGSVKEVERELILQTLKR
jgi:DNA-binding NtrC family response regulator